MLRPLALGQLALGPRELEVDVRVEGVLRRATERELRRREAESWSSSEEAAVPCRTRAGARSAPRAAGASRTAPSTPCPLQRVDDVERRGRRVDLHRHRLARPRSSVSSASRERLARAEHPRGGRVGEELALARDRELEERRRDRRDDDRQPARRSRRAGCPRRRRRCVMKKKMFPIAEIAPAIIAAIDETRMSRFLMCANSWASTPRTWSRGMYCSSPCGDGDRRVLRVAAGRERVRLLGRDQVDARLRHAVELGELADELVQIGRLRLGDLLRAGSP